MPRPVVALIVETSDIYGRRILQGIARYLRAHEKWSIFLDERELGAAPPPWLSKWKGDGIICRPMNQRLAKILKRRRIAVVDLNDEGIALGFPRVWSDMIQIGRLGAEHFLERSFQHFAFCGFKDHAWSELRYQGFAQTLAARNFSCFKYTSTWRGLRAHPWERQRDAIAAWLRSLPHPVGVMACNDVRGQHVLDAARSINAAVPEEIAVLGVDNDDPLCELCDPPLSSIVPNPQRVGYEAAALLDRMMNQHSTSASEILIEPIGVEPRQSSDILAIADPDIAAAVRHVREHACNKLKVTDLLKIIPLSRPVLERRFRKILNRSPQAEIRRVQIDRAKQLLAQPDLPIKTIAALTGFDHPEYLNVMFKRETGKTPGQFRQSERTTSH